MTVEIEPKSQKELFPSRFLQQTAFWGRLKQHLGCSSQAFDIYPGSGKKPKGDFLVLLRWIQERQCMAYVPFGPELLPDPERRGPWLEAVCEGLRPQLPEDCLFLRFDLPWYSPWTQDPERYSADNVWLGQPRTRVREMRMNFDTNYWNLRKACTDLLPTDTVILDLRQNLEEILAGMKPKTRYNIRLARRRKVQIREAGPEELPLWYSLYQETANRHGMLLDSLDYFRAVLGTSASDCASPGQVRLLLAELQGQPVAGILIALSGNRATYLYGASSAAQRDCMAPYALQWQAIQLAKEQGCLDYDLFGISPNPDPSHPMYGLYRFKTGFGGRIVHRQGCWDYPLDQERYELCRSSEITCQAFVA
ncbi:MAG: lipid II:glycine glycyltransferase FemX [Thermodesulfobacteriota bacterium]